MIPHRDEILRPAVGTDATAVPRYNLVRPDGTIIEKNVAMRLANPVAREGTPISKVALDEMLAASGVTAGTATAYTLAQEEYTLFDGAPVRFRLHTASGDGATLNINGTGAKPLRDMMGAAMPGGIPAGTWLTAYYSAAAGAYVLAGGEAVRALYGERYTVDDAVAYVKDVPADALPAAEIGEVGGMTYKVNVGTEAAPVYELRSAAATAMQSVGVNLIPPFTLYYNISDTTGEMYYSSDSAVTDFIRIRPNTTYLWSGIEERVRCDVYCYNENKVYMGRFGTSSRRSQVINVNKIVANQNIVGTLTYIRLMYMGFTSAGMQVSEIEQTLQLLNEGDTALPYTPYFRDTLPIPEAVRALDGYGWGINKDVYNYIDWKNKRFVKRVGKRVLDGTEAWTSNSNYPSENPCFLMNLKAKANCVAISSQFDHKNYPYLSPIGTTGIFGWKSAGSVVYFASNLATVDEWKAYLASLYAAGNPLTIYYELAEPIITDISSLLPADNILRVQSFGTITAVNEYNYAVPTKITYQRDALANRASIFALEKLRFAMELLAKADLSNASGTFGGVVKANAAAVSALGTAQVRNVTISAVDLTAGSSALATGDSYHVYA